MRYYLDTNILVFLQNCDVDELSEDVRSIINDRSNLLYTSSVCVHEVIQLCQIGKLDKDKHHKFDANDIFVFLERNYIDIVYTNRKHLETMAGMPALHSDPYDRLIIAQSISDKMCVISSDRKFRDYRKLGLRFVYNER